MERRIAGHVNAWPWQFVVSPAHLCIAYILTGGIMRECILLKMKVLRPLNAHLPPPFLFEGGRTI